MSDLVYSRASHGAKTFSGILQNVSDPNNPEDISLDNAARYFVQFLSPSGILIEKEARVNRDEVENTGDDMDIYYTTTPEDPVYAGELGRWQYRVGVEFDNNVITTSPYWVGFTVVT